MKMLAFFALVFTFVISCSWTPDRGNTVDPHSPFYVEPHFNHTPVVDSVRMITDCYQGWHGNFCAFEVYCWFRDADNNVIYDSVIARVGDLVLGRMAYNPTISGFSLRKLEEDLPTGKLTDYVGQRLSVTVEDDSGATAEGFEVFQYPQIDWPRISHPLGDRYPDTLNVSYPRLGWYYWRTCDVPHSFSVSIFQDNLNTVWDTSGMAHEEHCLTDTFVVVTDSLHEAFPLPVEYEWYLTVTTQRGDRRTSAPGHFLIQLSQPPEVNGKEGSSN